MTRAPFDDLLLVPQALFGSNEHLMELIQIGTADIAQLHALEIIPDALIWVQIRGVTWQLFQMQAFGRASAAESL